MCVGYTSLDDCTACVHVLYVYVRTCEVCSSQIIFYCDAIHNLPSIIFVNNLFSLFSPLSVCTYCC